MTEDQSAAEHSTEMLLEKPLLVMFAQDGAIFTHLWPRPEDTFQGYALLLADLVRHVAAGFEVDEDAVWEWVEKEHRHHTTGITRLS